MQFNWIFVIIAGALILGFFVMIVNKQRQVSEKKLAAELLADMDMIINGQAVSPGSSKLLDMADLELKFTCEDYSIKDVPRTPGSSIVFSPSMMKGTSLIAWTLEWDMPYRAANFIYLTVPDIKYYLISPALGPDGMGIKSDFPETVDLEVLKETPAEFEDSQRIRMIYLSKPQASELPLPSDGLKRFSDDQVSVLYLDNPQNAGDFDGKTTLHFYKKKGDSVILEGNYTSMGKEPVYGAIFTDDYELYVCNMGKALKKLEVVTGVYKQRVSYLLASLPSGDPCSPYYVEEPFDGIIDSITDVNEQNQLVIHVTDLFSYIKQIQVLNDRTIFGSCPEIY